MIIVRDNIEILIWQNLIPFLSTILLLKIHEMTNFEPNKPEIEFDSEWRGVVPALNWTLLTVVRGTEPLTTVNDPC